MYEKSLMASGTSPGGTGTATLSLFLYDFSLMDSWTGSRGL